MHFLPNRPEIYTAALRNFLQKKAFEGKEYAAALKKIELFELFNAKPRYNIITPCDMRLITILLSVFYGIRTDAKIIHTRAIPTRVFFALIFAAVKEKAGKISVKEQGNYLYLVFKGRRTAMLISLSEKGGGTLLKTGNTNAVSVYAPKGQNKNIPRISAKDIFKLINVFSV